MYSHNSSGVREILLAVECRMFDDCTYRYNGVEMRGDGSSYELRFRPTAGMTYSFQVHLKDGSDATHIRFSIFPPDSIASKAAGSELEAEMATMFGRGSADGCDVHSLLENVARNDGNVVDIKMGSFAAPADGRQSWGDFMCQQEGAGSRCCEDPTHVGPPSQPCGGTYRHFPGETFDSTAHWEWTAPSTGEFLLKVTSNCDVPFYADSQQPGCHQNDDGLTCSDSSIERCASAVGVTIVTVDRAVRVKHRFDIPLPPQSSRDQQTLMASMFQTSRPPAMSFPTKLIPLDCNNEQSADRPVCVAFWEQQQAAGSAGHRRDLQEVNCPHSTFLQREAEMLTACRLPTTLTDLHEVQLPSECPSPECAERVVQLLGNCQASISSLPDAALYRALEQSSMLADCQEFEQVAAQFATVEVEFDVASLQIAQQMIAEHEARLRQIASMFSQQGCVSGRGRRLRTAKGAHEPLNDETESQLVKMLRNQLSERDAMVDSQAQQLIVRNSIITRQDAVIDELLRAEREELIRSDGIQNASLKTRRRHLQNSECVAEAVRMEAACCDAADLEGDSCHSFPNECSTACASLFFEFDALCQSFINTLDESQRTGFARLRTKCDATSSRTNVDSVFQYTTTEGGERSETACMAQPCLVEGLCLNDGTCVTSPGSNFRCECVNGWGGARCETR
eukprot:SAG31_NODE_2285_length_6011_cov_5.276556_6_plen_680_part_00